MKKAIAIIVFGLLLIYFVALALIPNEAQAKDKSISKRMDSFHLSKDIVSANKWALRQNAKKK